MPDVIRIGRNYGGEDELTGDEEAMARASIRTIVDTMAGHLVGPLCLYVRQTGPVSMGVMAFDVCGLPDGHEGLHQAGWTGTGEWFK